MIENLVKTNINNRVVGPPKGKVLEGQPPRYSNQQQLKKLKKKYSKIIY